MRREGSARVACVRACARVVPNMLLASEDIKQKQNERTNERTNERARVIVQELCESPGGRPGLSVLTSLLVSVDGKAVLNPASAFVSACP